MASLKSRSMKFPVPNEPDEWMAFRRLSEQEIQSRTDLSTERFSDLDMPARFELALAWLQECLVAWSYEEPCTVGDVPGAPGPADAGVGVPEGDVALAGDRDSGGKKSRFAGFHAYLDGDPGAGCPRDWLLSVVCEAFHCTPRRRAGDRGGPGSDGTEDSGAARLRAHEGGGGCGEETRRTCRREPSRTWCRRSTWTSGGHEGRIMADSVTFRFSGGDQYLVDLERLARSSAGGGPSIRA